MTHGHDEAHEQCEFAEKAPPKAFKLDITLRNLNSNNFFLFWYTGRIKGMDLLEQLSMRILKNLFLYLANFNSNYFSILYYSENSYE